METYSITVTFEDEHEGQWTRTLAILATSEAEAIDFAREYVQDAWVAYDLTAHVQDAWVAYDLTAQSNGLWKSTEPRLVAILGTQNGKSYWRAPWTQSCASCYEEELLNSPMPSLKQDKQLKPYALLTEHARDKYIKEHGR